MRLALISDVHLECLPWEMGEADFDVLVGAGDLYQGGDPVSWLARQARGRPAIFVPGNHDFFGFDIPRALDTWRKRARGTSVSVLYNESLFINGVRFLGTPLWSGLAAYLGPEIGPVMMGPRVRRAVGDFTHIFGARGGLWTPTQMVAEHLRACEFLDAELPGTDEVSWPTVVVSHWPPARRSLSDGFENHPLNAYFVNANEPLVERATLWCHGHVHQPHDYRIGPEGRGRVVCNPRGYTSKKKSERPGPYAPLIIEV